MKNFVLILLLSGWAWSSACAQEIDPNAPTWGLYASGVGARLSPCMDPCWVVYTVALTTDASILANIENGTMAAVVTNVTWREATAQQRRFSRYYDDQADGTWKCSPCETPKPDLSCHWSSTYGNIYWGQGYYGSKTKTISGKLYQEGGTWYYQGTWGRTNGDRSGKVLFKFNSPTSFTGYWTEGNSTKETSWSGSGKCK